MELCYPVHYAPDTGSPHIWTARIPGLDGTEEGPMTCGDDRADVQRMASDLVDVWITNCLKKGEPIPVPGDLPPGEGWELVAPSLRVRWVIQLRMMRAKRGWSQVEVARRMGIKQPQYADLEDPSKSNPTLKTLERIAEVFGTKLELLAS